MQRRRGRAYSQDLRERVFALYDVGDAVGEIADALCVSTSYDLEGTQPEAGYGRDIGAPAAVPRAAKIVRALRCDLGRGDVASGRDPGRVAPLARRGAWRLGKRRADARHARKARADA